MEWLIDFILFCLATIGFTRITVDGKIADPFRKWVRENDPKVKLPNFISYFTKVEEIHLIDIITCDQCCGFWSGLICGLFTILPYWLVVNKLLLFGWASSYICMLGTIALDYWNAVLYMTEDDDETTGSA